MRRLALRLAVSLAAVTLIGLSIIDVAFIAWVREQVRRERALALRVAAADGAAAVVGRADPRLELERIAALYGVVLTAIDSAGGSSSTGEVVLPPHEGAAIEPSLAGGFEHWAEPVRDGRWSLVVASFALESVPTRVLATQRAALPVLGAAALVMLAFGLVFLRRAVLRPIARMTERIGAADDVALERLGSDAGSDDLARLGRAIVAMRHRIASDREHIAAQLAKLERAHSELTATQAQLVRAERLAVVGQLAAGLAHEVGNPLTVVGGFAGVLEAELAQRGSLAGDDVRDALARMQKELDRISGTVRALLDFSRAPESASGRGDVGEALLHVRRLLSPQERLRDIELAIEPPAGLLEVALATDALTQVLVNLVFNAADAIRSQPKRAMPLGRIVVRARAAPGHVLVTVDDSGPGIPAEVMPRIFEPFFTTKPAGQGTGLGLAVCERIVSAAGGELSAGAGELGGARLTIAVPGSPAR